MLVWLNNVNIAEGVAEVVVLTYAPGGVPQNFSGYTATWRIIQDGKVWASGPATLTLGAVNVSLSALQTAMPKPTSPQKLNAAGVLEVVATNGSNTFIFNATVILARREDSDDGIGILSSLSPEPPPSSPPLLSELNLSDLDDVSTARTNLGLGSMALQSSGAVNITGGTIALAAIPSIAATAAELNILDGVTATASEINAIDGVTATGTALIRAADAAAGRTAINAPPLPQSGAGVGQWTLVTSAGAGAACNLPAGGTWAYFVIATVAATGAVVTAGSSVAAGGTNVYSGAGNVGTAMCWRIA